MTNYTAIPGYCFEFGAHPTCKTFATALNNSYAEDFDTAVVASFFTDPSKTTVTPNLIFVIREAIIATVLLSSTADRTVVAPIINRMPLFGQFGTPPRKFPIRSPSTFTSALDAVQTTAQHMYVVIRLNTASLWLDSDNYNVMDFDRISITGPVCPITIATHPGVSGAAAGPAAVAAAAAAAVSAAAVLSPAASAAAATAANQALLVQQAAHT